MKHAIECDAGWAGCEHRGVVVTKYQQSSGDIGSQCLCLNCRQIIHNSYVTGDYWFDTRSKHVFRSKWEREKTT